MNRADNNPLGLFCGIEYEYLLMRKLGTQWQLQEHGDLDFHQLSHQLEVKPGRCDPALATGDLGVKSGYWYLEGDERFDEQGNFTTMAVKGIEIRTPPKPGIEPAIASLLAIEQELSRVLLRHELQLGIAGFHPVTSGYDFVPPLNGWEQAQRRRHRGYDAAHVSTLSYGPDINLSFAGWTLERVLAATCRLMAWAPYIIGFSFSSPYYAGKPWHGPSRRTFARSTLRPAVKCFWPQADWPLAADEKWPLYPTRIATEQGRIEFKAFDAIPSVELLEACCYLLVGLCLAEEMPTSVNDTGLMACADPALFELAACHGFTDPLIHAGAARALACAEAALGYHGLNKRVLDGAPRNETTWHETPLAPLHRLLDCHQTPADLLRGHYLQGKAPCLVGGLAHHPQLLPASSAVTLAEMAAWESLYGAIC